MLTGVLQLQWQYHAFTVKMDSLWNISFYTIIEKRWYSLISQTTPSNPGLHLEHNPVPKWHFSQFKGHGLVHCGTFATGLGQPLKNHTHHGALSFFINWMRSERSEMET